MSERVYIKFGDDGEYFEVEVVKIDPITTELLDDMPVERKKWGDVLIKNRPYEYRQNQVLKNRLFSEILLKEPSDYIYIKHVGNGTDVTEGYFGVIDCEFDGTDKKLVTIKPEILDQYTDLLEYQNTKVDVFKNQNIIKDGLFLALDEGVPIHWSWDTGDLRYTPSGVYFLDNYSIALKSRYLRYWTYNDPIPEWKRKTTFMYQMERAFGAGQKFHLTFFYQLLERWVPTEARSSLNYCIQATLSDGTKWNARSDGRWTPSSGLLSAITYKENKLPLPADVISNFEYHTKVFDSLPLAGTIAIYFQSAIIPLQSLVGGTAYPSNAYIELIEGGELHYESDLILTNISLETSRFTYKNIEVKLNSENLVIKPTGGILDEEGLPLAMGFSGYAPKKEVDEYETGGKNILTYYFDVEDGSPDLNRLSDSVMGFRGRSESGDILDIGQYTTLFESQNSNFFMGEICEVAIFQLDRWSWIGLKRHQVMRATVYFAREESYSTAVYTSEDEELELIPDGKGVGDPKPPSEDEGWVQLPTYDPVLGWLWVRKPFNGSIDTWELTTGGVGYLAGGEKYTNAIRSKKIYPIGGNSKRFDAAVSLMDIIRAVFNGTHPSLSDKQVYSTFLNNDYPSDANTARLLEKIPILRDIPSTNYVTLGENYLKNIACLHTYALKTEKKIDDTDNKLLMSFDEMMEDLRIAFPSIYFFMDLYKNLHIEHLKYEDITESVAYISNESINYQRWSYDKNKLFPIIEYKFVNSGYREFSYSKMEFDKIVSNRRRVDLRNEQTSQIFTSDVQYCIENPDGLDNGLILLNYDEVEGNLEILRNSICEMTRVVRPNGDLSIGNMLINFGTHTGTWHEGTINGRLVKFKHTPWAMKGLETIELKGIYNHKYFLTNLGIGIARKTLDYGKNVTLLELDYRYNEKILVAGIGKILKL